MDPKMPTYSSADTQHREPEPLPEPDDSLTQPGRKLPWAHKTFDSTMPDVPLPGGKRHPVYVWLEEHGRRLIAVESVIAGCLAGLLVGSSVLAWLVAINLALWWLGW